jgi:hypothetical protein
MNMNISLRSSLSFLTLLLAFFVSPALAQELSVEQVIAKHRDAIAPAEKLSTVKNQMVLSDAKFTYRGSAIVSTGKGLILSEGDKTLWGMNFNSNDYPQDRFGFDGKDVRVGRPTPAAYRSLIGEFIYTNRVLLKDGLLGGVLSTSWALRSDRKAKYEVEGKKTIEGKETIVLSYSPRGGSDLGIKMYFDDKTFQHVRTEYSLVRAAAQGPSIDASANRPSTIYKLIEDFSGFTKAGDLTLPKTYRITYTRSGAAQEGSTQMPNRDAEWTFTITNVTVNEPLEAGSFKIDG